MLSRAGLFSTSRSQLARQSASLHSLRIAVVVDNHAYLFDADTGVVRRAAAATKQKGIAGLAPRKLRVAFLTHRLA
jgi:hypothetical protein